MLVYVNLGVKNERNKKNFPNIIYLSKTGKIQKKSKILKNRVLEFEPLKISNNKNKKIKKVCFLSKSTVIIK